MRSIAQKLEGSFNLCVGILNQKLSGKKIIFYHYGMSKSLNNFSDWDDFQSRSKVVSPTDGPKESSDRYTWMYRANARYRAATLMELSFGTEKDGDWLREETARGYRDILRLAMSYAAMESLNKAVAVANDPTKARVRNLEMAIRIDSEEIGELYRSDDAKDLRDFLNSETTPKSFGETPEGDSKSGLQKRLINIEDGCNNVTAIAQAIRHLAFHGVMTPSAIRYRRPNVQELLRKLREEALATTDQYFSQWCTTLAD